MASTSVGLGRFTEALRDVRLRGLSIPEARP
jgi:hypothetical protein